MDLNTLPPQQVHYLNLLTKFSGRTSRLKPLNPGDMSKRKEVYITENMVYLSTDDQVSFNECKMDLKDSIAYCKGIFFGGFLLGMLVSISRTSATKSLGPGAVKSGVLGLGLAGGFYQYNYMGYQRKMHGIYVKVLSNKRKKTEEKVKE